MNWSRLHRKCRSNFFASRCGTFTWP